MVNIRIPNRIRKIREGLGWTQGQLAKLLDVTQSQLNQWEQGTRGIPDEQMIRLREELHLKSILEIYLSPDEIQERAGK